MTSVSQNSVLHVYFHVGISASFIFYISQLFKFCLKNFDNLFNHMLCDIIFHFVIKIESICSRK